MQKPDGGEPRTPEQNFIHVLHIDDAEDEDEFVEDVVPELVLDALRLGHAQAAEHGALQHEAEQRQRAVRYVDHGLEQYIAIHIFCFRNYVHESLDEELIISKMEIIWYLNFVQLFLTIMMTSVRQMVSGPEIQMIQILLGKKNISDS